MDHIRRRQCLFAAGALLMGAMLPPLRAQAQQAGRVYRIGVLFSGGSDTMQPHQEAVRETLAKEGFVEHRNLQTTWRASGTGRNDDREIARELAATKPDAILAFSTAMTQAAQWVTNSIPIVFVHVSDPISDGIVKDFARPGGNTTGVSNIIANCSESASSFSANCSRVRSAWRLSLRMPPIRRTALPSHSSGIRRAGSTSK